MRIAVLGAGAWGTALALNLCARHHVTLWVWDPAQFDDMRPRGKTFTSCPVSRSPRASRWSGTSSPRSSARISALSGRPTSALARPCGASLPPADPFQWSGRARGSRPTAARLPHQVAEEALPPSVPRGVLSGPSFALEVARGLPTAVTLAATDHSFAVARPRDTPQFASAHLLAATTGRSRSRRRGQERHRHRRRGRGRSGLRPQRPGRVASPAVWRRSRASATPSGAAPRPSWASPAQAISS